MLSAYVYYGNNSEVLRLGLNKRPFVRTARNLRTSNSMYPFTNGCNFIWLTYSPSLQQYRDIDSLVVAKRVDPQKLVINILEGISALVSKDGVYNHLTNYYLKMAKLFSLPQGFSVIAKCFIVHGGVEEDEQLLAFKKAFRELDQKIFREWGIPKKHLENNQWIVKPVYANRGRGIEVFKTIREIKQYLSEKLSGHQYIIQKYIERPLLYQKRKFDIRMWGLIHQHQLYLYKDGYMRTSSYVYDINEKNQNVHLTNNCLQIKDSQYGSHEVGNTLSFQVLAEYLSSFFPEGHFDFYQHIYPQFINIAVDSFKATHHAIDPDSRPNSYQLIGFDFLIDEDLRVWLIEVNDHPYLGYANDYIRRVMPLMIDHMLQIVLDPVYRINKQNNNLPEHIAEVTTPAQRIYKQIPRSLGLAKYQGRNKSVNSQQNVFQQQNSRSGAKTHQNPNEKLQSKIDALEKDVLKEKAAKGELEQSPDNEEDKELIEIQIIDQEEEKEEEKKEENVQSKEKKEEEENVQLKEKEEEEKGVLQKENRFELIFSPQQKINLRQADHVSSLYPMDTLYVEKHSKEFLQRQASRLAHLQKEEEQQKQQQRKKEIKERLLKERERRRYPEDHKREISCKTQNSSTEKEVEKTLGVRQNQTTRANNNNICNLQRLQILLKKPTIDIVLLIKWLEKVLDELSLELTPKNLQCLRNTWDSAVLGQVLTYNCVQKLMNVIIHSKSPTIDQELVLLRTLNSAFTNNVPRCNLVHECFFPFLCSRLFLLSQELGLDPPKNPYMSSNFIAEESIEQSKEENELLPRESLNKSLSLQPQKDSSPMNDLSMEVPAKQSVLSEQVIPSLKSPPSVLDKHKQLLQLYENYLLKIVLTMEKYFYIPKETHVNQSIKDYCVEYNLVYYLILIQDDQGYDKKLRSDIQFKFFQYLGMDHWTIAQEQLKNLLLSKNANKPIMAALFKESNVLNGIDNHQKVLLKNKIQLFIENKKQLIEQRLRIQHNKDQEELIKSQEVQQERRLKRERAEFNMKQRLHNLSKERQRFYKKHMMRQKSKQLSIEMINDKISDNKNQMNQLQIKLLEEKVRQGQLAEQIEGTYELHRSSSQDVSKKKKHVTPSKDLMEKQIQNLREIQQNMYNKDNFYVLNSRNKQQPVLLQL